MISESRDVGTQLFDTITLFKLSAYAEGLVSNEKEIYMDKLCKCNVDCPYVLPKEMWQKSIKVLEKFLPTITEHELYMYLIARRSKDTQLQLNAMKTMQDAVLYVTSGWVSALSGIQLADGKVIVTALVHHSQSLSKKELLPWVCINTNKIILAAHCQCTAGLGGVCCHVGAVLYSVIAATTLPCTAKQNVWLDTYPKRAVALINKIGDLNTSRQGEEKTETEKSFSVSQSQSDYVARFTIKQYKTPLWNRYRAGLSTASNSYAICHTSLKIPSQSLLKKICYPAKHHFSTEATRYGIENESRCIKKGCDFLKNNKLHVGFTISKCGLILSTTCLGTGATPDGLFHCDCHGNGVVEVKCSWKHKDEPSLIDVAKKNNDFFLMHDIETNELSMKKNHPYYFQVQHQMMVTNRDFCIFMAYIESDVAVILVPIDEKVVEVIKSKTCMYTKKIILPQLLCEHFLRIEVITECAISLPSSDVVLLNTAIQGTAEGVDISTISASSSNYKTCCQDPLKSNEDTAVCANIDCIISVYHKCCVKPPRKRFGRNLICKNCVTEEKKKKKESENVIPVKKSKQDQCKRKPLQSRNI